MRESPRCRLRALIAFALTAVLWALARCRNTIREAISRDTPRVVRVVLMPSEGTARAWQLAPSAVTASAAGGIGDQKCGAESNNRRRAMSRRKAPTERNFNPLESQ